MTVDPAHGQLPFLVRLDWGLDGARAIAPGTSTTVVVDVLSFTTTVSVALDAGIDVLPYPASDAGGVDHAVAHDAVLAVPRSSAGPGDVSLSPASLRAARGIRRLVLPSPNGSTIAAHLSGSGRGVLAASLRNATAIAEWITAQHGPDGAPVAVVPSGERWPGGTLRPAVEDLWGAGAVVVGLLERGWTSASPEARTAAAAFREVRAGLGAQLRSCASGAELIAAGHPHDVDVAAELDLSRCVPALQTSVFRDVSRPPQGAPRRA
ncbi:2-phosphosulfolactate phosphatase [Actinotalea sp. Marseille-Q4924]|uniref:2-phosphosulfolactate phosphatase n=1 Tax=Actinotalea sp. Marseille-Q4924 TaxID=2866571 RepID=UPI001CE3BEAB|nr:2-phosphosulfolactate phosphatase [Actinotalea sp. Marseille-Q4924]